MPTERGLPARGRRQTSANTGSTIDTGMYLIRSLAISFTRRLDTFATCRRDIRACFKCVTLGPSPLF